MISDHDVVSALAGVIIIAVQGRVATLVIKPTGSDWTNRKSNANTKRVVFRGDLGEQYQRVTLSDY